MAEISKITLPSGNTYDLKDATARDLIAGGITFTVSWDGASTPVVANIPQGVVVTYNGTNYTGTKTAASAELGTFYLVKSGTGTNAYDEYVVANSAWEKLGSQEVDLSNLGGLAYKDNITLNTGSGDTVLGTDTTFTVTQPTITVTPSTTTVPNVTAAGSASSWSFSMGTGANAETLIISGTNGSAPTLGTPITAVTEISSATASGAAVSANNNDQVTVAEKADLSITVS